MMTEHFVSIIIPVLNQVEKLDKALSILKDQLEGVKNIEVIVVDNNSTDGSEFLAQKYNFRAVNYSDAKSPYQARNKGASIAKGNILVFLDAKCKPDKDYISEIQTVCQANNWDIVAGDFDFSGLSAESSISELAYAVMYLRTNPKYNGGEVSALTGNMIVSKKAFIELGGFDERRSGGDVKFSQKAEKSDFVKMYNPKLRVAYQPKQYLDLIQSIKRDTIDLPHTIPLISVRPASRTYIDERLDELDINISGIKKVKLMFFIMYLRLLKYYHQ